MTENKPSLVSPNHLVAVTGATGFIGRALISQLVNGEYEVVALCRKLPINRVCAAKYLEVGDLTLAHELSPLLNNIHTLVHTAGRAHILNEHVTNPLFEFRRINVDGTLNLAKQAAAMGVKRFIFLSSIGVHGLQTHPGKPFTEIQTPNPHNSYALSKWEAEEGLKLVGVETGMEIVIIRPPLVYGPYAPGNFGLLMHAVLRNWPLPLGGIPNQRSLVSLDNLLDFIVTCLNHPCAANQTFLVSDGCDLSTTELVESMARVAGLTPRIWSVPRWLFYIIARVLKKKYILDRLYGNLQVDITRAKIILGWTPPVSVDVGLQRAMSASAKFSSFSSDGKAST
jgi:nucleoside-diphosphate-sugar epimerase